jgi:hypothetical protein
VPALAHSLSQAASVRNRKPPRRERSEVVKSGACRRQRCALEAVDKKKARLNCISHLLDQIPYQEIARDTVALPPRVHNPDYHRGPIPPEMYVPARY